MIAKNELSGTIPTEVVMLTRDMCFEFDETKIEVSDGDYYYNDTRDNNYNAVSDLPEIETEIEI